MKKTEKNSSAGLIACGALTVVLIILLTVMAYLLNSRGNTVKFDLASVTYGEASDDIDVTKVFVPEFAGISAGGKTGGTSVSPNVAAEIFRFVSPVIADMLSSAECTDGSAADWERMLGGETYIYLRYHTELPECVLGVMAAAYSGAEYSFSSNDSCVYETIVIPGADSSGVTEMALRSRDGEVKLYKSATSLTRDSTVKTLESYSRNLTRFTLTSTEPVFTEGIFTRSISVMKNAASVYDGTADDTADSIMRFFGMNPEKLLSTHSADGVKSYTDTHGMLTVTSSSIKYETTSEGGVGVGELAGRSAQGDIGDYIKASCAILSRLTSISKYILGGDADVCLGSVDSEDGVVTLGFMYVFDNIPIKCAEPALNIVFENGILRSVSVYTLFVRNLGERRELISESWFTDYLGKINAEYDSVTVVYAPDDASESENQVKAVWGYFTTRH